MENGTHFKQCYLCRDVFAKGNRWQDNHFPADVQDSRQKLTWTAISEYGYNGINYVWH